MYSLSDLKLKDLKLYAKVPHRDDFVFSDELSLFFTVAKVCDNHIHQYQNTSSHNDGKKRAMHLWEQCYIRRYDLEDLIAFLQQVQQRTASCDCAERKFGQNRGHKYSCLNNGQENAGSLRTLLAQALAHYQYSRERSVLKKARGPNTPQDLQNRNFPFLRTKDKNAKGGDRLTCLHRLEGHTGRVTSVTAHFQPFFMTKN